MIYPTGKIPDESIALQLTPQAVSGMLPGQPTWPASVVSSVCALYEIIFLLFCVLKRLLEKVLSKFLLIS